MNLSPSMDVFLRRLDEIRLTLRWASAADVSDPIQRAVNAEIRASSFVGAAGAIERFFREFVALLAAGVNEEVPSFENLRLSLHAIASSNAFRSLEDIRDFEKRWMHRVALLELTSSAGACTLPLPRDELAIGGESVRPVHVATIWRLFGLPTQPFALLAQEVSLRVIADNRNDVAHGNVDQAGFAANPESIPAQILLRLGDVEGWAFHCWEAFDSYFAQRLYLRT